MLKQPLFLLLLLAAGAAAADPVVISLPAERPVLRFGAEEVRSTLAGLGEPAEVKVGARAAAIAVAIEAGVGRESYAILREGEVLRVRAGDDRGALCALLEIAEQARLGGGRRAGRPARGRPFHEIRAIKFNLPIPGGGYVSESASAANAWMYDPAYWSRFFAMMARNRYNALTFWSAHPYHQMTRLAKYPEACPLNNAQLARNREMFSRIFRLAREHGIDTYLITWNIHLSHEFARAHSLRPEGQDSPLVRDYLRESVAALLREYPDLTGLGTCPGENMPMSQEEKQRFIEETYFAGMRQAKRWVPFVHRYWQGDPVAIRDMIRRVKPQAPVLLDIKFNGEHMYSSPTIHLEDQRWVRQAPEHYRLFWHFRNDDLYTFRWADPAFARQALKNCGGPGSAGYLMGSEGLIPGPDRLHADAARAHQDWEFEFEKSWLSYALWGRLGYDPEIPDAHWEALTHERFGEPGERLQRALVSASRILPTVTAYHWNYMNGDWDVERCTGLWNTNHEEMSGLPNWRDGEAFHSVEEFAFTHTIDDTMVPPLLYAARLRAGQPAAKPGQRSPLDVAADLERWAGEAMAAADADASPRAGELACVPADLNALARLGCYYAAKIRAAAALSRVLLGDEAERPEALAQMESARDFWVEVCDAVDSHYRGGRRWRSLLPQVERDLEIVHQAKPFPVVEEAWDTWSPPDAAGTPAALLARPMPPERGEALSWEKRTTRRFQPFPDAIRCRWLAAIEENLGMRLPGHPGSPVAQVMAPLPGVPAAHGLAGYLRSTFPAAKAGLAVFALPARVFCRLWVAGGPAESPATTGVEAVRWHAAVAARAGGPAGRPAESPAAAGAVLWRVPIAAGDNTLLVKWARASEKEPAILCPPRPEAVLPAPPVAEHAAADPDARSLRGPFRVVKEEGSPGGRVLLVPADAGRGDDADRVRPIESGRAAYTLAVPEAGTYRVWLRHYWASPEADSVFVEVDGGQPEQVTSSAHQRWGWTAARAMTLSAGKHVVVLRNREANVRIDRICLIR